MKSQVTVTVNIQQAKEALAQTAELYFAKDAAGNWRLDRRRARPVCLMGPAGIGKTEIVRQVAEEQGNLVTIGITPDYPETGYGYIRFLPREGKGRAFRVDRFVEKPDLETAKSYLATEQYLWNSGMFIWRLSTILSELEKNLPETSAGLQRIAAAIGTDGEQRVLEREYEAFSSESIDYGVMEKAEHIYTLPGSFGWNDVGSWLAVEKIRPTNEFGNVVEGNAVTVDTVRCIIQGGEKLIAAVGLEDMIIVDTPDALLVCDKSDAGSIKKVLENLKICNRNEYL